jgi:CxxC motif-containing protein (DUF1111 family)
LCAGPFAIARTVRKPQELTRQPLRHLRKIRALFAIAARQKDLLVFGPPKEGRSMKRIKQFALVYCAVVLGAVGIVTAIGVDAPTGVDNLTADPASVSQAQHVADQETFEEHSTIETGLGPVFNMRSCVDCHQQPVTGGISQVFELRAGSIVNNVFTPASVTVNFFGAGGTVTIPDRSLVNQEAICPAVIKDAAGVTTFNFPNTDMHERITAGAANADIRSIRATTNILGDGFVEVIADSTLLGITAAQRATPAVNVGTPFHPSSFGGVNQSAGENTIVDLLERPGFTRVGRFGWKSQLASLVSFSGGAYLNEMGVTNRIAPHEVTGDGVLCDTVADPEDQEDVTIFARFMRMTKPQSPDPNWTNLPDTIAGSALFDQIGCAFCHTRNITTAPAGTVLHGVDNSVAPGVDLVVSAAFGSKTIHPFSDFALHNVHPDNIGDTQANGQPISFLKTRTAPLWGVRFRNQMMHDGVAESFTEAILNHGGEANFAQQNFQALSTTNKNRLLSFLRSL